MNHPSREFCRGCGAELVYNPMRPRFGAYPRSQGGKFVTLAALSLVFLAAAGIVRLRGVAFLATRRSAMRSCARLTG